MINTNINIMHTYLIRTDNSIKRVDDLTDGTVYIDEKIRVNQSYPTLAYKFTKYNPVWVPSIIILDLVCPIINIITD
jgi:hypothetical protein